jgi:predicted GIY-YIG superfamily endonuclease
MSGVYLLHFHSPISAGHPCRHYLGSAADVGKRLAQHKAGRGSRLCQVAVERGVGFELVRVWPQTSVREARTLERALKAQKNGPRFCPICGCGKKREASVA